MNLSIAALLEAAEYLERREREAEHGYASSHVPTSFDLMQTNSKKSKIKKSQGNRTTHNELEKNRRAHLRGCLERLKELVPLGAESSRHTTLGLLNKAKGFIRNLEEKDKKQRSQKVQLIREQRFLLRRLDQLSEEAGLPSLSHELSQTHRTRSISESSSGISSASTSPTSEVGDDQDIMMMGSHSLDLLDTSTHSTSSSMDDSMTDGLTDTGNNNSQTTPFSL